MLIAPDGLAGIPEATVSRLDASEAGGLGRLLGAPFTPTGQLGAPLSRSEEKEAAQLLRAVSAREPVLEALSRLPDTQAAWVLVRFCASGWCRHTARLLPPSTTRPALRDFDAAVLRCVVRLESGRKAPFLPSWPRASSCRGAVVVLA